MLIKIKDIVVKDRLRKADPKKVQELAESIKILGLLQPIVLNKKNELVAGLNRLEACKSLGVDEIKIEYMDYDDSLREELAELDENLVRSDFHYIDRGIYLMRKKEIYDTLNNTKSGPSQGLKVKPFTDLVAEKTNQSKRTIQNEIKIAKDVIPVLQEQIKENNIGFVKAVEISRLDKDQQKNIAEKLKTGDSSVLNGISVKTHEESSVVVKDILNIIQSLKLKLKVLKTDEKRKVLENIESLLNELDEDS